MNKKFGALSSSVDPEKLSATVTGIMNALAGILMFFGQHEIATQLSPIAQQVGTLITMGYAFYGACQALFGLVRKVIVSINAAWMAYKSPASN